MERVERSVCGNYVERISCVRIYCCIKKFLPTSEDCHESIHTLAHFDHGFNRAHHSLTLEDDFVAVAVLKLDFLPTSGGRQVKVR